MVEDVLGLPRHGEEVDRNGKDDDVAGKNGFGNGVKAGLEGAGMTSTVAGVAGMAAIEMKLDGIEGLHFGSLTLGLFGKPLGHLD